MEKLVLEKQEQIAGWSVLKIQGQDYANLKELSKETNIPMSTLFHKALTFALSNISIIEPTED